jgi:hypothetical protein
LLSSGAFRNRHGTIQRWDDVIDRRPGRSTLRFALRLNHTNRGIKRDRLMAVPGRDKSI